MKTDKPYPGLIGSMLNTISDNFKELFTWINDTFFLQDKEVIERSAKTFRWHFKEILLSILLAFLLAKVDKVQHFFTSFAIDIKEKSYTVEQFLWAFFLNGLAVVWLSYVFWHKPKHVTGWINRIFGDRRDRSYDLHFNLPNGLWWVAVVATLPVVMVNIALSISLLKDYNYEITAREAEISNYISGHTLSIFFILVPVYLLVSLLSKPHGDENMPLRQANYYFWRQLAGFACSLLIFILLFYYFPWNEKVGGFTDIKMLVRYAVLAGFILIPTIALTHVWYAASRCLHIEAETAKAGNPDPRKKPFKKMDSYFDVFRYVSYGLSLCIFFMLNQKYFTTDERFSQIATPVPVLLFVFIFYYQAWDFILHNVTRIRRNLALAAVLLLLIFFARREHFQLKYNGTQPATYLERTDMESFFLLWAYDRFSKDTLRSGEAPVYYLVAAEGGGSRSGAWTASVLTELDEQSKGTFRRNCFAISSVSGGTIGAAATLALWDNAMMSGNFQHHMNDSLYRYTTPDRIRGDRTDAEYIKTIFGRNYISTAIAGIFFYDFWQSVPIINLLYSSNYSRSDRHQDEENDAVSKGLSKILGNEENSYSTYFKHTSFLRLYYHQSERDRKPAPNVSLPLFFPNTTRVEDGRRGILSPVKMIGFDSTDTNANPFTAAVDVIGLAAKENRFRSISLSEAAGLSQLFPFVNSNVTVGEKAGRFMDGGAYENMGLTTLYEIRKTFSGLCTADTCIPRYPQKLKKVIQADDATLLAFDSYLSKIRFKFVLIYNINDHIHDDDIQNKPPRQWLDPITTLLKTPFSGHTDHIYHKLTREFAGEIVEFALIDKNKTVEYQQDIVMSRWLSKYEMKIIMDRSNSLVSEKISALDFNLPIALKQE